MNDETLTAVGSWMLDQLPNHLRDDAFFCKFVGLFGAVAEGTFDHADALPFLADPMITPMPMVHHLARWLGQAEADRSVHPDRQRERLARIGALLAWRGTRHGLADLLRVLTQGDVEVVDDGGVFAARDVPRARKHLRIVRVRLSTHGDIPIEQLVATITAEIPANCVLDLWIGPTRVATESRVLGIRP
jgi:phage tail-like protein